MELYKKYGYTPEIGAISRSLDIIAQNVDKVTSPEVLKTCFSIMDMTTLRPNDTPSSVRKFVEKINGFYKEYPDYPLPASVCVYPNFAGVVREVRCSPEMHVTTVSTCFPSTQSFIDVKVLETRRAIEAGADEIDVVLSLASFLDGDYAKASADLVAERKVIDEVAAELGRPVVMKVILETGLLVTPERIADASFLAMEAGADFIKTSTGKVDVNATPMSAFIMCECIKAYYKQTGRKVGFKAAGGVSTAEDAVVYYAIVSSILGPEWLNKELFRFGVSRLGNSLVSAIEQKTVAYF